MIDDDRTAAEVVPAQEERGQNLGEGVYRVLWERILRHELRPGDKLSDLRLSVELGVSRTPVREALQRLVQDGIVRAERHRGFAVVSFSARDIAEIYDLRAIIETGALRLALPNLDAGGLRAAVDALDAVTDRLGGAGSREAEIDAAKHFLAIDRAFHRWLVERAGNARLTALAESLWGQIAVFQQSGLFVPARLRLAIDGHHEIIDALRDGDGDLATERLGAHILGVKDLVIADHAEYAAPSSNGRGEPGGGAA